MKFKKAVIIGVGLIGGSIAKAIKEKSLADEVIGICRRQSSLDRAIKEGAITKGYVNNYAEAVKGADIVFIATPVETVKENLKLLAEVLKDGKVLITDAGSTKKEIVDYAHQFKGNFSFVGGHPLAGSEKTGVEFSSSNLFAGSVCALTQDETTKEKDLNKLKDLWEALGAKVKVMTPGEHDEILSFTSHLPHIIAYALSGTERTEYKDFVSTGFKDTTRIASSSALLWSDIFMSNRDNVLKAVARFKELLLGIEEDIRKSRTAELVKKLEDYKKIRDEIL